MTKRHCLLMLMFALVALATHVTDAAPDARPTPSKGTSAPKALFQTPLSPTQTNKAFHAVTQQLTKTKVLRASFRQRKHLKALRLPLHSRGTLLFASGAGVQWTTIAPFPASFAITSKGIIQRAGGQVTRIKSQKQPMIFGFTQMFLAIFSGNQKALHKHFKVYFKKAAKGWWIGLIPKDQMLQKVFRRIVLRGDKTIEQVKMFERRGERTEIDLSNIKTKPATLTKEEKKGFSM